MVAATAAMTSPWLRPRPLVPVRRSHHVAAIKRSGLCHVRYRATARNLRTRACARRDHLCHAESHGGTGDEQRLVRIVALDPLLPGALRSPIQGAIRLRRTGRGSQGVSKSSLVPATCLTGGRPSRVGLPHRQDPPCTGLSLCSDTPEPRGPTLVRPAFWLRRSDASCSDEPREFYPFCANCG
jgi:hypothetical protein